MKWYLTLGVCLMAALGASNAASGKLKANDYGDPATWLCRPGRDDICSKTDLTTSVVAADGSITHEPFAADAAAPVDCFYLYPTASQDETPNSDMTPDVAEMGVTVVQLARFASVCRTFAPLYRSVTARGLDSGEAANRELAYRDALDAWHFYLEHDNAGRGVILIGDSQGAHILARMVREEIEGHPIQTQILSAMLIGIPNKTAGPGFKVMPLCGKADQTQCIITFSSFRANIPPPPDSAFGSSGCVNPAAIEGGQGALHVYMPATNFMGSVVDWSKGRTIDTIFVSVPGLLKGECKTRNGFSYLEVTIEANPADPRTDDILGDWRVKGVIDSTWGLHAVDVFLVQGNLIDLARSETAAYLGGKGNAHGR